MLNFEADPDALQPLVPAGTELDAWQGRVYISLVGFQFRDTRVRGIPIPFHRDFEEVNLRFYVRRALNGTERRGVVFVKELVPRRAIAWTARWCYNENYVRVPMARESMPVPDGSMIAYCWRHRGERYAMGATRCGAGRIPPPDSLAAYITEHYWGYVRRRDGSASEYQVEHPRWTVWEGQSPILQGEMEPLYGRRFAAALAHSPASAFVAGGSAILVRSAGTFAPTPVV